MNYGIANGLVGFSNDRLRVRIERTDGRYVWCRTADLADAGTPLTLDASQVEPLNEEGHTTSHRSGFVIFE